MNSLTVSGRLILPLSMLGHLQAVLLHGRTVRQDIRVYYSPLARAAETAGHIAAELPHLPVSDLVRKKVLENGMDFLFDTHTQEKWPDIYEARGKILTIRFQEQKLLFASGTRFFTGSSENPSFI